MPATVGVGSLTLAEALSLSFAQNQKIHEDTLALEASQHATAMLPPSHTSQKAPLKTLPHAAAPRHSADKIAKAAVQVYNDTIDHGLDSKKLPITFHHKSSPHSFNSSHLAVRQWAQQMLSDDTAMSESRKSTTTAITSVQGSSAMSMSSKAHGQQCMQVWKRYTMPRFSEAGVYKQRLARLFGHGDMLGGTGSMPLAKKHTMGGHKDVA